VSLSSILIGTPPRTQVAPGTLRSKHRRNSLASVKLLKVKRPAGVFSFEVQQLVSDSEGEWHYAAVGSEWDVPHRAGRLLFDVVVLVRPGEWAVTWWVDEPGDRRVEVDVCLPPERTPDGWSFVDLELDVVRHESGGVEIQDEEEFEVARRAGLITAHDSEVALATVRVMADKLRTREEPWGDSGWNKLR